MHKIQNYRGRVLSNAVGAAFATAEYKASCVPVHVFKRVFTF